jgi:hypothetical protein
MKASSLFKSSLVALATFGFGSSAIAQSVPWAITLNQLGSVEQTDDPEFTENDEIYLIVTKTYSNLYTSTEVFPSNREISISEGAVQTHNTVIASGDLPPFEPLVVTVSMMENDESDIGALLASVGGAVQTAASSACAFIPAACVTAQAAQVGKEIGTAIQRIANDRGNQFLGSYTVQLQNVGAGLANSWLPGVGLSALWGDMLFFPNAVHAGWRFNDDSRGSYWATFNMQIGAPHF